MTGPRNADSIQEVSKSQRKREAQEYLALARKLVAMPGAVLMGLPLDTDLRQELAFANSIRSHGARKRQLMTLAKLLRNRDTEELEQAVANLDQKNRQANARFHHVEAWRDKLVGGDDSQLGDLLDKRPDINAQTVRQLIRNACKEAKLEKPPAAARKLFKLLREADAREPLPPV
ncbi:MAG: ribosome biogenesis factor YjgA [Lysobacterales bacterium]|jgi:ribosome-associated protein